MPTLVGPAPRTHVGRPAARAGSTLGALGVVFGDIGTSPLYAIQIVFALSGGLARPTSEAVYGVASLEWFHLPDSRTITLGWQVPL